MPRIRRVDCSSPGHSRRKHGRGFAYYDARGRRITASSTLEKIKALAIPPAWADVWICPNENGHLQAVGIDSAGRKQYTYHPGFRERRNQIKYDRMIRFARALPFLREQTSEQLDNGDLTKEKVLACAVRLLDRGFFRAGGERYAKSNRTFGIATIEKSHVKVKGGMIEFDFPAKGGQRRVQSVADPKVLEVVRRLKQRRSGGNRLLAFRSDRGWVQVRSSDINRYIRDITGEDFTAKDFRTWTATVIAALALAVAGERETASQRKQVMNQAAEEVSRYLGNTRAVARSSYIDPRVFDRYLSGWTIRGVLGDLLDQPDSDDPIIQGKVEEAVINLIEENRESPAIEKAS